MIKVLLFKVYAGSSKTNRALTQYTTDISVSYSPLTGIII